LLATFLAICREQARSYGNRRHGADMGSGSAPSGGVLAFPGKSVYGSRTVFARVTVNCDLMR